MMTITQVIESDFLQIIKLLDYDNEIDCVLAKLKDIQMCFMLHHHHASNISSSSVNFIINAISCNEFIH